MNPIDPDKFSLDYLIENKVITILSRDYVVENGKMFGECLWWDRSDGYYICDFSGDEEVYFTGLGYDIYINGNIQFYRYYKNGLEDGIEAKFYPSGVLKSYTVIYDENKIALAYEWYENGMIKMFFDRDHEYIFNEHGEITEQGQV